MNFFDFVEIVNHFNFREWPRWNLSLQHQYNNKQTSVKNKGKNIDKGIIGWSNIKFSQLTF